MNGKLTSDGDKKSTSVQGGNPSVDHRVLREWKNEPDLCRFSLGYESVDALNARDDHAETAEDYVEAVAEFLESSGECRVSMLADKFAYHVTASRIVRRLDREGLWRLLSANRFIEPEEGLWPSDRVLVASLFLPLARWASRSERRLMRKASNTTSVKKLFEE